MIQKLFEVEDQIPEILKDLQQRIKPEDLNTMLIDYHEPFVHRIWFQYDQKHRVYLHKIFPSSSSEASLYHPHPWISAVRIIKGTYEMGIGHSETDEAPVTDCKMLLGPNTVYEMTEPNGWHYVNPIDGPTYSLMVTGELNDRKMPIEPNKKFVKLNNEQIADIFDAFDSYYSIGFYLNKLKK